MIPRRAGRVDLASLEDCVREYLSLHPELLRSFYDIEIPRATEIDFRGQVSEDEAPIDDARVDGYAAGGGFETQARVDRF